MLELLLAFALAQEPRIITCTIVEPYRSVSCNGEVWTFDGEIEEWKYQAPMRGDRVHPDALLIEVPQTRGQEVKAIVQRTLTPIEPCEVRVWRNIKQWRTFRAGELIPNSLYTLPDDCQPWYRKEPNLELERTK